MIQELLQQLGLSTKEIEIFLALFEQGKTTPARLSKITNVNRSTVYAILSKLKERGLVVEDIGAKVLYFSPASSEQVQEMFYRQQEDLKERKKIAEKLAVELEKLPQSRTYSVPKIRFIEEGDLEEYLYKRMDRWDESLRKEDKTFWGFQDDSLVEHYMDWINWVWKHYDIKVKLISNQSQVEKELSGKFKERKIGFWGGDIDFSASTWVMGDYLVMIVTRQHPFYLVEIHDAVMAHNMREVFKKIWQEIK
ncbi:MAG: helix-turn-helix domain-containing protein [Candidatus Moraniibacteriota bacterium]